jgi:hypothetical protein
MEMQMEEMKEDVHVQLVHERLEQACKIVDHSQSLSGACLARLDVLRSTELKAAAAACSSPTASAQRAAQRAVVHVPVLRSCLLAVVDVEGPQAIQETQASIARIQEMTRQAEVCQRVKIMELARIERDATARARAICAASKSELAVCSRVVVDASSCQLRYEEMKAALEAKEARGERALEMQEAQLVIMRQNAAIAVENAKKAKEISQEIHTEAALRPKGICGCGSGAHKCVTYAIFLCIGLKRKLMSALDKRLVELEKSNAEMEEQERSLVREEQAAQDMLAKVSEESDALITSALKEVS